MKSEESNISAVPTPQNTREYLFRVWLGTYERLLYGYTVTQDPEELVLQMDLTVAYVQFQISYSLHMLIMTFFKVRPAYRIGALSGRQPVRQVFGQRGRRRADSAV